VGDVVPNVVNPPHSALQTSEFLTRRKPAQTLEPRVGPINRGRYGFYFRAVASGQRFRHTTEAIRCRVLHTRDVLNMQFEF
jgi:hypothetical protein